jgi:S-(hydroxymethyl)glutathione dehydrogenase/alcohol dehydrogenase
MSNEARAAILCEAPGRWEVHDVVVDAPREREVLVRMVACGLCHSDDHFTTGDITVGHLPICGGHEAAGVVEAVGPGVVGLAEGDHIVSSFVPGCGRCRWCATGRQNLCENGALLLEGTQIDGTFRMHFGEEDVGQNSMIGGFSEVAVLPEWACVKVDHDVPLEIAAILGCAVPTGWGSAQKAAEVGPGDTVVVYGAGGIGMSAVQGAKHCGAEHILVVDPVEGKRRSSLEFGATQAFADHAEATEIAKELTNGQGADSAIICVGVVKGEDVAHGFAAIRKAGTVVVTAAGSDSEVGIPVGLLELTMFQKRIQGALYGMSAPSYAIPHLIDLWRSGALQLEKMVTRSYALDEINKGYEDMHAGHNIRGVIDYRAAA